jgi:hypothetical protein
MEYKIKRNNVEDVYEVFVDTKEMNMLLSSLVRTLSYREKGSFIAPCIARASYEKQKIYGAILPNYDPMFEKITRIYKTEDENSYDSIGVDAVKVTPPRLARIMKGLIDNDSNSIYDLIIYKDDLELVPIEERINKAATDLENDPTNTEKRNELMSLYEDYDNGRYFDTEKLSSFYEKTRSLVSLTKIKQTTYYKTNNKCLLKNFK